ncbi:MAG: tail fiber domain-containing protein, partial [Pyrinomonadaceae bacterium]
MLTRYKLIYALLSVCFNFSVAVAQEPAATQPERAPVTVAATAERVRFAAPNRIARLRLEVLSVEGGLVFEADSRGSVFDWTLSDSQGARVIDGTYLCVVTIKDLGGRLSQRLVRVEIAGGTVAARAAAPGELTPGQAREVGPVEEGTASVMTEGEPAAATLLAHDGHDGQIVTTTGALSFRGGDFFTGRDRELMRLSADGSLDVLGALSARGGIRFSDGSVLNSAAGRGGKTPAGGKGSDSGASPLAAGSGTLNRLAKWSETGGAGTLTDSLLSENAGRIEVNAAAAGTGVTPSIANPSNVPGFAQLHFYPAAGTNANMSFAVVPRGTGSPNNRAQFSIFGTDLIADPANYEFAGMRARGTDFLLASGKSGTGQNRPFVLASGFLTDNVTNANQLFLATNGNVGVGTNAPTERLHVSGNGLVAGNLTVSGALSGNGSGLTNLNAGQISMGTLDSARLGVVPAGNGGTGLSAAGAAGNFLRSNGTSWTSSALQSADIPAGSGNYIQINPASQQEGDFNISGRGRVGGMMFAGGLFTVGGLLTGGGVNLPGMLTEDGMGTWWYQPGWSVWNSNGHLQIFNAAINQNAMWVDAVSNNVGVGTTSPGYKLHVNGTVAGVGPYVDASDLRYKRDIRAIPGALSKVLSLRGVTFDWRREEFPALNFASGRQVGFVAQEVERVVPEAVVRDTEGFRSVAYSHLTP